MFKVIYTRPDGEVNVVNPGQGISLSRVMERSIPADATNVQVVTEKLPDHKYRNAWRQDGEGKIVIDLAHAKLMHAISYAVEVEEKIIVSERDGPRLTLKGDTVGSQDHEQRLARLKATDFAAVAIQINDAVDEDALRAIVPE